MTKKRIISELNPTTSPEDTLHTSLEKRPKRISANKFEIGSYIQNGRHFGTIIFFTQETARVCFDFNGRNKRTEWQTINLDHLNSNYILANAMRDKEKARLFEDPYDKSQYLQKPNGTILPQAILPAYSKNRPSAEAKTYDQARRQLSTEAIQKRINLLQKNIQETKTLLEKEKGKIALKEETNSIQLMQSSIQELGVKRNSAHKLKNLCYNIIINMQTINNMFNAAFYTQKFHIAIVSLTCYRVEISDLLGIHITFDELFADFPEYFPQGQNNYNILKKFMANVTSFHNVITECKPSILGIPKYKELPVDNPLIQANKHDIYAALLRMATNIQALLVGRNVPTKVLLDILTSIHRDHTTICDKIQQKVLINKLSSIMPYFFTEHLEKLFDTFPAIFTSLAPLAEYLSLYAEDAHVECDFSFISALKNAPELSCFNNIMNREMEIVYNSRKRTCRDNPTSSEYLYFSFRTICNLYEFLYKNLLSKLSESYRSKNIKEIAEIFPEIFPNDFIFTLHEFKWIITRWADEQEFKHFSSQDFACEFEKIKTLISYQEPEANNAIQNAQDAATQPITNSSSIRHAQRLS